MNPEYGALPEHPSREEMLKIISKNFQRLGRPFKSPGQIDEFFHRNVRYSESQTEKISATNVHYTFAAELCK